MNYKEINVYSVLGTRLSARLQELKLEISLTELESPAERTLSLLCMGCLTHTAQRLATTMAHIVRLQQHSVIKNAGPPTAFEMICEIIGSGRRCQLFQLPVMAAPLRRFQHAVSLATTVTTYKEQPSFVAFLFLIVCVSERLEECF